MTEKVMNYVSIAVLFAFDYAVYVGFRVLLFDWLLLSGRAALAWITAVILGITAFLYVYYVYIIGVRGGGKYGTSRSSHKDD